ALFTEYVDKPGRVPPSGGFGPGSRASHQATCRCLAPSGVHPSRLRAGRRCALRLPMGLAVRLEPRWGAARGARRAAAVWGHRFGRAAAPSFVSSVAKTADCITALLPARGLLRRVLTRSFRFAPGCGFRARPFPVG